MLRLKTALVLAVRYLFLTRFSWLMALVLIALVPLSLDMLPRLLANLFVFDLPEQIFHVSWISMWCAATATDQSPVFFFQSASLSFSNTAVASAAFASNFLASSSLRPAMTFSLFSCGACTA